jgi:hypothetical protein
MWREITADARSTGLIFLQNLGFIGLPLAALGSYVWHLYDVEPGHALVSHCAHRDRPAGAWSGG